MKFKKSIAIAVLCTFFMFSQSNRAEANPAVIVSGAVALGTMLFAAGAVKYYAPPTSTMSALSSIGTLGRLSVAVWQGVTQYGVAETYSKLVSAKISFTDMMSKVVTPYLANGGSPYGNLFSALTFGFNPPAPEASSNVGDIVQGPAYNLKITSTTCSAPGFPPYCGAFSGASNGVTWTSDNNYFVVWGAGGDYGNGYIRYFSGEPATVNRFNAKTLNQLQQDISNGSFPTLSTSVYSGEIDHLITSEPNIVHFADTANPGQDIDQAPPFAPPSSGTQAPATPKTTSTPTASAATAASTAAAKANALWTDAGRRASQYKADHPFATVENDPVYKGLVDAVTSAESAYKAATNVADQTAAEANIPMPSPENEPPEKLNINSWFAMMGTLTQLGPYKLLQDIEGWISQLVRPPEAPKFNFPLPLGNSMTIDLALFDPVASIVRWSMSLFIAIGTVLYAVRFWRGN